jgi:hypothetical protein
MGVGEHVALAPLIFLAASYPRGPAVSVVLTDWLSMTPAVGLASRPAASRDRITREWLMVCHNPSSRHPVEKPLNRRKRRKLLGQQPPLTTCRQPVQHRIDHLAQRGGARSPQLLGASIRAHFGSLTSLA